MSMDLQLILFEVMKYLDKENLVKMTTLSKSFCTNVKEIYSDNSFWLSLLEYKHEFNYDELCINVENTVTSFIDWMLINTIINNQPLILELWNKPIIRLISKIVNEE